MPHTTAHIQQLSDKCFLSQTGLILWPTAPCVPGASPQQGDILWNTHKRKLADKDESAVKKQTGNAGGEFEWNINGLIEEIPDHGNVDVVAILHVQPEELS